MVFPRLLRLQRRVHALALAAAGFFLIGFGASRNQSEQAAEREPPAQAERATDEAEPDTMADMWARTGGGTRMTRCLTLMLFAVLSGACSPAGDTISADTWTDGP